MSSTYQATSTLLKALAHPVRLQVVDMLRQGEVCVCHIEAALGKRQAYVSQQLMILRDAGLVETRKDGLQVYYRLADETTVRVLEALYGSAEADRPDYVDGCCCPACSSNVLLHESQGELSHVTG